MKANFKLCSTALSLLLLFSCSQTDEQIYSCDPKTDTWVKQNIQIVGSMSRADWLSYDVNKANALYRAFSPSQKRQFWIEKFAEVKKLKWSVNSLEHISVAETFIKEHEEFFTKNILSEEDLDTLETFFYKWQKYGVEKLGWKKHTAMAIAATGLEMVDTLGTLRIPPASDNDPILSDCNCNTHILSDFCGTRIGPCEKSNCDASSIGCGWILAQSCNGRCGGL